MMIHNRLVEIISVKKSVLAQHKSTRVSLYRALKKPGLQVIAEIKRASPSKGILADISSPVGLAASYLKGGASAISVITEEHFFKGHIEDLKSVKTHYPHASILRKDFITDNFELCEAVVAGADAVLLIVKILQEKLKFMLNMCHALGLEALVEVHNLEELQLALDVGAKIIGINHRNLETFEMDSTLGRKLIEFIPKEIATVAESGIHTLQEAEHYHKLGFDGVLIGEALVTSSSPDKFIRDIRLNTGADNDAN